MQRLPETKQFPPTKGPKIRVGTLAGCCVRFWYSKAENLPESGEMQCPTCSGILKRDGANWWKGAQKDTLA